MASSRPASWPADAKSRSKMPAGEGHASPAAARQREPRVALGQARKSDAARMYLNSPVLKSSLAFGFSHKNRGQCSCLDAASGKTLWLGDGRQGENAATVPAGALIVSLTNDASLVVSTASATGLRSVRTYKAADRSTWAHPVLVRVYNAQGR
jgi:hypothetical protein